MYNSVLFIFNAVTIGVTPLLRSRLLPRLRFNSVVFLPNAFAICIAISSSIVILLKLRLRFVSVVFFSNAFAIGITP